MTTNIGIVSDEITRDFAEALRIGTSLGIRRYEIRPGIVATDMTGPVKEKYDRLIAEGLTPIRRWGAPEDVGKAVVAIAETLRRLLRNIHLLKGIRRNQPISPHPQTPSTWTSTGTLFQPHWKLDGGRDAASPSIRQPSTRLSHSVTMIVISRRARWTPRQKCCPRPKASSRSMGRFQTKSSGLAYSRPCSKTVSAAARGCHPTVDRIA